MLEHGTTLKTKASCCGSTWTFAPEDKVVLWFLFLPCSCLCAPGSCAERTLWGQRTMSWCLSEVGWPHLPALVRTTQTARVFLKLLSHTLCTGVKNMELKEITYAWERRAWSQCWQGLSTVWWHQRTEQIKNTRCYSLPAFMDQCVLSMQQDRWNCCLFFSSCVINMLLVAVREQYETQLGLLALVGFHHKIHHCETLYSEIQR